MRSFRTLVVALLLAAAISASIIIGLIPRRDNIAKRGGRTVPAGMLTIDERLDQLRDDNQTLIHEIRELRKALETHR